MLAQNFNRRTNVAMEHNVSQLGKVVEIEVQMFGSAVHFNRCTDVQTTTKPAILPNCC